MKFIKGGQFDSFISVVNENVSLVISRQLLSDFCAHLPNLEDSVAKQVAHFTLEKVHTRVISFEEQVSCLKQFFLCSLTLDVNWAQS